MDFFYIILLISTKENRQAPPIWQLSAARFGDEPII